MDAAYDLVLLHAPSVYDFRTRDDVLFAYLGNSDSVHVSPVFEMPPVGMLAIRDHLTSMGYRVGWFNLASRMLRDADFDVPAFLARLESPLFGLDLHWMAHAQGALAVAEVIRDVHPKSEVLFGGQSASYYADELIRYSQVDLVQRGYNTLEPITRLVASAKEPHLRAAIPDLLWKDDGEIRRNPPPTSLPDYNVPVDWGALFAGEENITPYRMVVPQAGCRYNCRTCGGSNSAFRRLFGLKYETPKPSASLTDELRSHAVQGGTARHTVTLIDYFHEDDEQLQAALDGLSEAGVKTVHISLHRLPDPDRIRRITSDYRLVLELSPDTHDQVLGRRNGRGSYSMEQMEAFIDALKTDVRCFEVYFMIGLPGQDEASVNASVDYCEQLVTRFPRGRVIPYICPMLPFLDPASEVFEDPDSWGYTLFHRTLEEHRQALISPTVKTRLNYETHQMDKDTLIRVSYEVIARLTRIKVANGLLPRSLGERIVGLIAETRELMAEIDGVLESPPSAAKEEAWSQCKRKIWAYNHRNVAVIRSQQRPTNLGFAGFQWFDTDRAIDQVLAGSDGRAREGKG